MEDNKTAGRCVCSLRPHGRYFRYSEGDFLRLANGNIFFAFSRFSGSSADDAPCEIAAMWSADEGETWSEPVTCLSPGQFDTHNIMSISLLRMKSGEVGMFFGARTRNNDHFLALSDDEGSTFRRFIRCTLTDRLGYYVLNNDRVERLQSGRLVMPMAYHRGGYDSKKPNAGYFDHRGAACFRLSDDDGETWREARQMIACPFPSSRSGFQETGVIEKRNGVLWAYFRTDIGRQFESFSMDGGESWTAAQPSRFTSPCSPLKITRRPDGALVAVWNPIPHFNGRQNATRMYDGRTPIVYAVSADDGDTWTEPVTLEGKEDHSYAYPALFFTDDEAMLTAYCSGGPGGNGDGLEALIIRKVRQ